MIDRTENVLRKLSIWVFLTYLFSITFVFPNRESLLINFEFEPLMLDHYTTNVNVETYRTMYPLISHPLSNRIIPDITMLSKEEGWANTDQITNEKAEVEAIHETVDDSTDLPISVSPDIAIPNAPTQTRGTTLRGVTLQGVSIR